MIAILKVSARRYMALDVGPDDAYHGAPTWVLTPQQTNHGMNIARADIIAGPADYSSVMFAAAKFAQEHNLIVSYEDSKSAHKSI